MEFSTIVYQGKVKVEAILTAAVKGQWDEGFIYLEWAGPEAAVRAIWAHLVSGQVRRDGISEKATINGEGIRLQEGVKYINFKAALSNEMMVMAIRHPITTANWREKGHFYLLGTSAGFLPRLARCLEFPIDEDWEGWLWEEGLLKDAGQWNACVSPVEYTIGLDAWKVKPQAKWFEVVQEHFGAKKCTVCRALTLSTIMSDYDLNQKMYLVPYSESYPVCPECAGIFKKGGED